MNRVVYSMKRALYFIKRALQYTKRALYSVKKAIYSVSPRFFQRAPTSSYVAFTHCNTLQHTATHCNTHRFFQHALKCFFVRLISKEPCILLKETYILAKTPCTLSTVSNFQNARTHFYVVWTTCNTLQHTAAFCNTLQLTVSIRTIALLCDAGYELRCYQMQRTVTHFNTLQHTATHCHTLQHTLTHYDALEHTFSTHTNTLLCE